MTRLTHCFLSRLPARFGMVLLMVGVVGVSPVVWAQNLPEGVTMADGRSRAKAHTELAALYFQDGNMAVAMEELQVAIQADPSYAPAYNVRGLVNNYLRETAAAEADFQKALSLTPQDPEVNNNYGWFLCQQPGGTVNAIRHFMTALKNPLYATPDRAYLNAGSCALRGNDLDAAEDYLQKGLRVARDAGPQLRFQLAELHYRRSNLAGAQQLLGELMHPPEISGQVPGPELLWLALRIERKLAHTEAAADLAASLRKHHPASREYQEFLKGNFE